MISFYIPSNLWARNHLYTHFTDRKGGYGEVWYLAHITQPASGGARVHTPTFHVRAPTLTTMGNYLVCTLLFDTESLS